MKKIIILSMLMMIGNLSVAQSLPSSGDPVLDKAMSSAKGATGDTNSKVSNPFSFCSGPKPSKHTPERQIWDQICPSGNAKPAASPVGITAPTSIPNTTSLQNKFNQTNGTTTTTTTTTNNNNGGGVRTGTSTTELR